MEGLIIRIFKTVCCIDVIHRVNSVSLVCLMEFPTRLFHLLLKLSINIDKDGEKNYLCFSYTTLKVEEKV